VYKSDAHKLQAVIADLKAERLMYEPLWQDVDDHVMPGQLRLQINDTSAKGIRNDYRIINSTADKAFETFQNGMIAHVTNPSQPWIELEPEDPGLKKYGPVATFCEDVAKFLLGVTEDTGAYEDFKAVFGCGGKFASSALWMEENYERVIHTQPLAMGSWWIGKDQYGDPNILYREFRMTVRTTVEKFCGDPRKPDWSKVSNTVKQAWDRNAYGEPVNVGHMVMPNDEYNPRAIDAKDNKRFKSCYFELDRLSDTKGGMQYLRESGYDEFPALFFPWDVVGDDVYGMNSPGIVTLPDNKELQHWALTVNKAVDKMVDPPLMGPPWAKMLKVGYFPGQITALNDQDMQRGGLRPLHEINPKVLEANDRESRLEARIKDGWYERVFRYLDVIENSKRTATEIAARQQQNMLELVGTMNRINRGMLIPYVERMFNYAVEQGRIGGPFGIPVPDELQGKKLKLRFVSQMAQAMRAVNISGVDRFLETALMVGQVEKMGSKTFIFANQKELLRAKADALGLPARIMRSDEEIAEIEMAQAKQQAMAAQAEQMMAMTQGVKNLAQSPTDGKNALTDVASALGEQAA
jgi:hypothetical protein